MNTETLHTPRINDAEGMKALAKLGICIQSLPERQKEFVFNVMQQSREYGLTARQWSYVKKLAAQVEIDSFIKPATCYYVYAISNGDSVKIGITSDVNNRLKLLKTSNPKPLVLLRCAYVSHILEATAVEKRLHLLCKEHRLSGEWFTMDALAIFDEHMVKTVICTFTDEFRLAAMEAKKDFKKGVNLR